MGNLSELVDIWKAGLGLRKRSCLHIWSSSTRKGSLREDVFMGQESNHDKNWALSVVRTGDRWHLRRNNQGGRWEYEVMRDQGGPSETGLAHGADNAGQSGNIKLRRDNDFNVLFCKLVLHCLESLTNILIPFFAPSLEYFFQSRRIEES